MTRNHRLFIKPLIVDINEEDELYSETCFGGSFLSTFMFVDRLKHLVNNCIDYHETPEEAPGPYR